MRNLKAYHWKNLAGFSQNANGKPAFYAMTFLESVMTPDGLMELVKISESADLRDPDTDVAMKVGNAIAGHRTVVTPLLYWRDSFWLKAVDSTGTLEYYHKHNYLIYRIELTNSDQIFKTLDGCI